MPKITSYKKTISGKVRTFTVMYNQKHLFHFKESVDPYVSHNTAPLKRYETQGELIEAFDEVIEAYHKAQEKTRKVLRIHFGAGTLQRCNVNEWRSGSKSYSPKGGKWSGCHNISAPYGISLDYEPLYEVDDGDRKRFYCVPEDGGEGFGRKAHINNPDRFIWVNHTQEREDFLRELGAAIEVLGERFADFFTAPDLSEKLLLTNNLLNAKT